MQVYQESNRGDYYYYCFHSNKRACYCVRCYLSKERLRDFRFLFSSLQTERKLLFLLGLFPNLVPWDAHFWNACIYSPGRMGGTGGGSHVRWVSLLLLPPFSRSLSFVVSIETRVQVQESVRGKDVFVIQTVSK